MSSPLFFRVYKNNQIHVVKQFVNDERIVIGNGAGVQIDLQSPEVSSIHCLIERRDGGYYLCDLGSEQGTFVEGRQILDQQINSGDSFNVGPFQIFFMQGNMRGPELSKATANPVLEAQAQPKSPPPANTQAPPPTEVVESTTTTMKVAERNRILNEETIPAIVPINPELPPVPDAEPPAPPPPKPFEFKGTPEPVKPKVETAVPPQAKAKAAPEQPAQPKSTQAKVSKPKSLKEIIRVGAGSRVEVVVSWQERIINTYHFIEKGARTLGVGGDVWTPEGAAPANWKILNFENGQLEIYLAPGMSAEILRDGELNAARDNKLIIREGEVCFVDLAIGMQLAIRFAPRAPLIAMDSPFVLGISEFTGVLAALILAVVLSLIVSVNKPKPKVEEEEIQRMAQVVFTKPPQPPPEVVQDQPKPPPPPEQPKPVEVKKVSLEDKKQPSKSPGPVTSAPDKTQEKAASGKASEVKPKDPKLTKKMFTSVKSGGQIKTGEKDGANLKSKEPDVKNTGLLSAFGSGGARSKLDKAYSGAGDALGAAEKATGASGFKSNSAGDDLGSRAKDTGAGGTGTATQGIAGVGTKGRGTGMTGSDVSSGFGEKGKVQIAAGGNEEEFTGSIDKEAVRRVVKSALNQFKACYEKEYRMNSRLEGKLVIQWEIHERGEAKNAKVVRAKSTINNTAVENCVRDRMLLLKFPEPPPGTAAEVTYPFIFQGQKL